MLESEEIRNGVQSLEFGKCCSQSPDGLESGLMGGVGE